MGVISVSYNRITSRHVPHSLGKGLVTLAVYPCAGRMQFDDV